jgi:hypothetical protein
MALLGLAVLLSHLELLASLVLLVNMEQRSNQCLTLPAHPLPLQS